MLKEELKEIAKDLQFIKEREPKSFYELEKTIKSLKEKKYLLNE